MHILHTVIHTFARVLTRRICSTINSFFSRPTIPSFSWPHECDLGAIMWGEIRCLSFLRIKELMIKQYQWHTFLGLLSSTGVFSSSLTTLHPLVTLPKTTCFPSRCGVGTVVMKNCEPLVFSPAFAIERRPRLSCCDKINKTKKLKQGISWLFF